MQIPPLVSYYTKTSLEVNFSWIYLYEKILHDTSVWETVTKRRYQYNEKILKGKSVYFVTSEGLSVG